MNLKYKTQEKQSHDFSIHVAGVTHENRQGYLIYLSKQIAKEVAENGRETFLTLRREPKNPFDSNAIQIIAHVPSQNKHIPIGYVPAKVAKDMAPLMDNGYKVWTSDFAIVGGFGRNYGMKLTGRIYK